MRVIPCVIAESYSYGAFEWEPDEVGETEGKVCAE